MDFDLIMHLREDRSSAVRVLQIAPYVSADGAYGGPVTVAMELSRGLRTQGHEVELLAGWDGRAVGGGDVPVRLFLAHRPASSFSMLVSPRLLMWVIRNCRQFDVVHVHLARDLLSLPAALIVALSGTPLVVQTHGMVRKDPRILARLIDRVAVRLVLRRAGRSLWLTPEEREDLEELGASALQRLENGVSQRKSTARFGDKRPIVVYVSRLAARKRPLAFVDAAGIVARARPDVRFELWGPDEGELEAVERRIADLGLQDVCRYMGAVDNNAVRALLPEKNVFVLPSLNEPFPMAVLEALAAGLPVVMTSDTGISQRLAHAGAAKVTDGSPERLAEATLSLLGCHDAWTEAADAGFAMVRADFSILNRSKELETIYADIVGPGATVSQPT
jgi:glycosyltransferase involved in cell wall biosynthesis